MNWFEVSKCDKRALAIMQRHYSRQKAYREMGPPGQKIILLTSLCDALWGSHRPAPWANIKRMDGYDAHSCFVFRNEGPLLSSDLIREAIGLTILKWGVAPQGFITYVAIDKVASPNPGYCFKQAGFILDGYTESRKLGRLARLVMSSDKTCACRESIG